MTNLEIAQIWANRERTSGSGSNLFFIGDRIYSYGTHYVAGLLLPNKGVAIINKRKYSVSTSKHVRYIIRASQGYRQIYAYYPDAPEKNTEETIRECHTLLGEYDRSTRTQKKARIIEEIRGLLLELHEYNLAVGYDPTDLQKKTIGRLKEFVNSYTPA